MFLLQKRCSLNPRLILLVVPLTLGCGAEPNIVKERTVRRPVTVKTVAVTAEEIQQTSRQPATVHAFYTAEIRARISGYTKSVQADIGDVVKQGQVLATIDVPELKKQKLILEAELTSQAALVKRAKSGFGLANSKIAASRANLKQAAAVQQQAEAQLAAAESEFQRTSDLVDRRSLEQRMLDEVRQRRDSAKASRQAAISAITSAEAEVGVAEAAAAAAEAEIAAAEARVLIAQRRLEELTVMMEYTQLKAPFAGVVTARSLEPGNLVRESGEVGTGQPLFVVSDTSKVRIHIPVPEADAAFVNVDDVVELTFPSFTNQETIQARVTRRTGSLDPSTRTMLVEVQLENSEGRFLPGMFGEASIQLAAKTARNVLPAQAVRFTDSGDAYVYVVSEDQTVSKQSVTTGFDNGSLIEVTSGVTVGQLVVDAHRQRLQDGQPIQRSTN